MVPTKKSRIQTWHSPGGLYHNQIDYILVSKRFTISVNINKTRSFPGSDIGSDHDMVMMTFFLRLKNPKKEKSFEINLILRNLKTQILKYYLKIIQFILLLESFVNGSLFKGKPA